MSQFKFIYTYGIPPKWLTLILLIFFTSLSLLFVPDSWQKGVLTRVVSILVVITMIGGFLHQKNKLSLWKFFLIGPTLIGTSMTLIFIDLSYNTSAPISPVVISLIELTGVFFILLFAFDVAFIYEKRLSLSGITIDLTLLVMSISFFSLFVHPSLLNNYELLQLFFFIKVLLSLIIISLSILLNAIYQLKRPQLLLMLPMSTLLLFYLLTQANDILHPLEKVQYYSPLSDELFLLAGAFASLFFFVETFSKHSIAKSHLEVLKNFTSVSNKLMPVTTILAITIIPIAIIIRSLFKLPDISLLLVALSTLFISIIAIGRFISIMQGVRTQNKKLLSIAHTDELTELPNYAGLYNYLSNKKLHNLLVVLINIDDFKSINNYYGRKFGDEVLISLGKKLKTISNSITSARIGTDNFIIVFQSQEKEIQTIISQLKKELGVWDAIFDNKIAVPLTFGACYKSDARKLEIKIKYAEQALQMARITHTNYSLFMHSDSKQELPRNELQRIFLQAIDDNYLPVHFQPIYNLHDGSLKALELLIRIQSEEYGLLLPNQFLEQAQSYGVLTSLTKICISMIAENIKHLPPVTININLPPYILKNPDTLSDLIGHIKTLQLNPKQLCFEITEDENIRADKLIAQVNYLTENSFSVAMDDFGTGHSSLERLSLLAFDTVKVDRSILLSASNGNQTILESSIGLIKRLGESVVVEGVETIEQLSLIKKLGADSAQGFLLSKPIPVHKVNLLPKNISDVVHNY